MACQSLLEHCLHSIDLSKLLASLQQIRCAEDEQDLNFLNRVLTSKEMVNLLRVHKKITSIVGKVDHLADMNGSANSDIVVPLVSNVFNISCEAIEILQSYLQRSGSRDARELMFLLQRPALQVPP